MSGETHGGIGERRELHAGKRKWTWVFLISLGFVALGIWMIVEDNSFFAWLAMVFFGAVALVAGLQLIGVGSKLVLEADGFELTNFGYKTVERWDEVANFAVYTVSGNEMVGYDRARDVDTHMGAMNRGISGRSAGLPDTFGIKAEALATIMNAYKDASLERRWAEAHVAFDGVRQSLEVEMATMDGAMRLIDLGEKDDVEAMPEDWPLWPMFMVVDAQTPLDADPPPRVHICVDVLNPGSRWVPLAEKKQQALRDLGAGELRIIDAETRDVAVFRA